jgi:hypothetical protein
MKKLVAFLCAIVITAGAVAQSTDSVDHKMHTRNIIYTTPVKKNTRINGLAVGLMAVAWMEADTLKVNGISVESGILGMVVFPYAIVDAIQNLNHDTAVINFPEPQDRPRAAINGISISGGGVTEGIDINGICLNGLVCGTGKMNGIEIALVSNISYKFNGLMIAGLNNKATTGKGLQIALINVCRQGQVIQIGLLNRIGRRIIPFINFSFKKPVDKLAKRSLNDYK